MNYKALALGAVVGFLVSLSPSCSGIQTTDCDATTCATGCCDPTGACIVATTAASCGTGGNACVACGAGQQCQNGACVVVDAGHDAGNTGCGPGNHPGCCSAQSRIPLPGTAFTNCGNGGANCVTCSAGQTCADLDGNPSTQGGECRTAPTPDGGIEIYGMPCTQDSDCTPADKSGAGAICKLQTSPGGTPYPGGYCTRICGQGQPPCSQNGICANASTGGEAQPICMPKCTSNAQCRTPGYACYTSVGVCYLDPFPSYDAGSAPPDLIGSNCASDSDCDLDGGFAPGFCQPETLDGGATGWTGGYCLADCTGASSICGTTAICLRVNQQGFSVCFDRCAQSGAGQSNCNNANYVCENYIYADGGASTDGYCAPHCANPGAGCPQGQTCNTTTGYCN